MQHAKTMFFSLFDILKKQDKVPLWFLQKKSVLCKLSADFIRYEASNSIPYEPYILVILTKPPMPHGREKLPEKNLNEIRHLTSI